MVLGLDIVATRAAMDGKSIVLPLGSSQLIDLFVLGPVSPLQVHN